MTVEQYGSTAVWLYSNMAVQQYMYDSTEYDITAVWQCRQQFGSAKAQQFTQKINMLLMFFFCRGGGRGGMLEGGWKGRELAELADIRTESYASFVSQILDTFLFCSK